MTTTVSADQLSLLTAFSLGRLTRRELMAGLRIDSDEALFLLMAHAGLPFPRLAGTVRQERVADMKASFFREQERLQAKEGGPAPDAL